MVDLREVSPYNHGAMSSDVEASLNHLLSPGMYTYYSHSYAFLNQLISILHFLSIFINCCLASHKIPEILPADVSSCPLTIAVFSASPLALSSKGCHEYFGNQHKINSIAVRYQFQGHGPGLGISLHLRGKTNKTTVDLEILC